MGVGLIIAAVTIGATVATTLFAKGPRSTKGADMAPANLDAFRLTTAEEGTVIPRVFGTVRLPGNLLYYGNLSSEPEYEETTVGGKGGKKKKQKVLQGYHYRMDVWQGIGMGPLELVGVYQDDRLLTEQGGAISCAEQVWNNGTGAFYPAQAGPYASRLPGVSHVWLRQFYLGFNVSMMPTLHYVVRFCGDIPLEHAILSNGVNPAAIILQLLLDAGASWSSIDKPSFSAAASFWAQKGYGLNIVFSRQKPVRDHIMQVLGADRVDRLSLAVTGKAMVPWPVTGLRAVRTGDSVAVSWSPVDVAFGGAGTRTENENEPVPAGFSGDFVLTAAGTEHVVNGTSITLTRSGRFALSVTARQLGYVSPAAYVTVESQDGEYVA